MTTQGQSFVTAVHESTFCRYGEGACPSACALRRGDVVVAPRGYLGRRIEHVFAAPGWGEDELRTTEGGAVAELDEECEDDAGRCSCHQELADLRDRLERIEAGLQDRLERIERIEAGLRISAGALATIDGLQPAEPLLP